MYGLKGSGPGMWSKGPGQKGRKGYVKGSPMRANGFVCLFVCLVHCSIRGPSIHAWPTESMR